MKAPLALCLVAISTSAACANPPLRWARASSAGPAGARVRVERTPPPPLEALDPTFDPRWSAYVAEAERRRIRYIDLSPLDFDEAPEPTRDEARSWLLANRSRAEATFETDRARYVDLPRQVRARHILVRLDAHASADQERLARARMALLVRRLRRESFAQVARDSSEDPGSASRGGDLGWNPRGRMVEPFDSVMFATRPHRTSRVVRTAFGLHVIRVEAVRQGDVPRDEALLEIAARLLQRERIVLSARARAEQLSTRLRTGEDPDGIDAELERSCGRAPYAEGPRVRTSPWFRRGTPDAAIVGDGEPLDDSLAELVFRESPGATALTTAGTLTIVVASVELDPPEPAGFTNDVRACLEARRQVLASARIGLPDEPATREETRVRLCRAGSLRAAACATCVPAGPEEIPPGTVASPVARACRDAPRPPD